MKSRFLILLVILGLAWLPIAQAQQEDAALVEDHAAEDLERLRDRSEKGDVAAPEFIVLHQPEQELERLRTLFREIIEQTEARIQQQAESAAASNAEAARLSEELANAQQEIERLTAALNEAEAVRAETEVEKRAIIQVVEGSKRDVSRLNKGLKAALGEAETAQAEVTSLNRGLTAAQENAESLMTHLNVAERTRARLVEQQAQDIEASNAVVARLNDELVAARQQMNELRSGLENAQTTLKELDSEFDALTQAIVAKIEELFLIATYQAVDNISQLRDKLGATTEQIDKLSKTVISESIRDAKGEELGLDDLTE